MRFLMFCLLAGVIVGGIYYRSELSGYFAGLAETSSNPGNGWSVTDSIQNLGHAAGSALGKAGDAFGR